MPIITVPKALREKLGDDGADALVDLFNQSEQRQKENVLEFVEEKFERRLSDEIGKVNQRITDEIGKVNQRITDEMAGVNQRITNETESLRVEIQQTRADLIDRIEKSNANLIKWVFAFWVGQVAVLTGILFAFFK